MTTELIDSELHSKIKHCFTANVWYLIVGIAILVIVVTYLIFNPMFNWGICISLILALSLIVYAILTIIKCLYHLNRMAVELKETTTK